MEDPDGSLLALQYTFEVADHRDANTAALHTDNRPLRGPGVGLEINEAIDPAIRALFLTAEGLGVDQRYRPPLELILVALGKIAGAVDVLRRAVDGEGYAGEGVFQAALDQRNREVRYVDTDPRPTELLGGVNSGPTAAEGIEDHIAGIG